MSAQLGMAVVTAAMEDDGELCLDIMQAAPRDELEQALAWAARYISERWERDAKEMGMEPEEWLRRQAAHLAAIVERDVA
jgi:hypothetical protein